MLLLADIPNPLPAWQNFYVIVGSSAGALIGLQFVVMTLLVDSPAARDAQAGNAFGTPNVVHFAVVLLLSALVTAPWNGIAIVAALWGAIGVGGVIYAMIVARRMRRQRSYHALLEDWLFYLFLPLAGYLILAGAAIAAYWRPWPALFFVAGDALLLLFIGIHNAWDTITYHVFVQRPRSKGHPETQMMKRNHHADGGTGSGGGSGAG